jgi:hypothetical protein
VTGPAIRPRLCFQSWGQIPKDDPRARPSFINSQGKSKYWQRGFYLINDGTPAHAIQVEPFEIEPGRWASDQVARIEEKGKGFALVWLEALSQWPKPEKFDLLEAMAGAYKRKYGNQIYAPDYSVRVSVLYRNAGEDWYRSSADMRYIQSRRRIEFGPTTHEGSDPAVDRSANARSTGGTEPAGGKSGGTVPMQSGVVAAGGTDDEVTPAHLREDRVERDGVKAVRGGANATKEARAMTVAKIIQELNDLKPQMFEDESEYSRLRALYPDFLTFTIAQQRPDLRLKILAIRGSARHIRLAQELAAAHHGRELSTIQTDWKNFKPAGFKRPR